jgi:hypothetical protein
MSGNYSMIKSTYAVIFVLRAIKIIYKENQYYIYYFDLIIFFFTKQILILYF